jgi:hypothetical protein
VISRLTHRRVGPVGVVLAGAAGVGKTRLAREALVVAQRGAPAPNSALVIAPNSLP